MHKPRSACEMQHYNQALSEMQLMIDKHPEYVRAFARNGGRMPDWIGSAMRQHALFYAREKCSGQE